MALSMGVFMLWMSWQASQLPPQEVPAAGEGEPGLSGEPAAAASESEALRNASLADVPAVPEAPLAEPPPPSVPVVEKTIRRERFEVTLSSLGGAVRSWRLLDYTEDGPGGPEAIEMLSLSPERAVLAGALTTPFRGLGFGSLAQARFAVESESDNAITFAYRKGGITVRKTYDFSASDSEYGFELTVRVTNGTAKVVESDFELLWPVVARDGPDFAELGLAVRSDGEVERALVRSAGFFRGGSELDERQQYPGPIDWVGIDTRYFVGVVAPAQYGASVALEPLEPGHASLARMVFPRAEIGPGQNQSQTLRAYIGPKEQEQLEAFGSELPTSISRGWAIIEPLTRFFEWLLVACYSVVGNYGLAIIVLTILVRVVTLPILQNQMKSMEKMRAVQPRVKELQELYPDDKQKQSEEMMRLYREEGVNPLGGCLPMLLQMPVFIGLFFALQSAIALRQAPFFAG